MPLHARNYRPGSPVYTYIANDGQNVHIDSQRLHHACAGLRAKGMLEVVLVPVYRHVAQGYLRDNVVSKARLAALWSRTDLTPVIFGLWDATPECEAIHIDGHHRYVLQAIKAWQAGDKSPFIEAHVLPHTMWGEYVIEGLMDLTKDQLKAAPLGQRDY